MGFRLFRKKKKTDQESVVKKKHNNKTQPPPSSSSLSSPSETVITSNDNKNYQSSYPQPIPPPPPTNNNKSASRRFTTADKDDDGDDDIMMTTKHQAGWLCKTRFFHNMCQSAFEVVDADGSGDVDEKELYSGLLLIHLKLGTYAGPAACKPISRERCHDIFVKMDKDKSGGLDKDEFEHVMMVLFGNVLLRVIFQYSCTLMIVPLVAQLMLRGLTRSASAMVTVIQNLDQQSSMANTVELFLERLWETATSGLGRVTPMMLQRLGSHVAGWGQSIPSSVWAALPLTLLSTILGLMIVPWSLMKIDDWFQALADKVGRSPPPAVAKPSQPPKTILQTK